MWRVRGGYAWQVVWRVCQRVAGVFQIEDKAVVSGCHIRDLINLIGRANVKDVL
jgi:hypothetical protein